MLGRGAGGDATAEELLRSFRIGEERIRKIVLGSPASPTLASTPPAWARCVACSPLSHPVEVQILLAYLAHLSRDDTCLKPLMQAVGFLL